MNRSYRLKIEKLISDNTVTMELLLICLAKLNPVIADLAYKEKRYAHCNTINYGSGNQEYIDKRLHYTEIRKPILDVLLRDYHMKFDDIKLKTAEISDIKIPTMKVCEQVSNMISEGMYMCM